MTLTRKKGNGIENPVTGYLFIMPQLILFIIFILYPIFEGFRMSLYRATYIDEIFVGFENYKILFEDPVFLKAMVNTILFVIGIVFFTIIFGLFVATTVYDKNPRYISFIRGSYYLPVMVSMVVMSMVWNFLPIVPRITPAQLAHVAQRLGDEAMIQGAPVTHIEVQHERPLFEQGSVRMDARGPVTLYEEPRWNRIRAMCERPTLLPVHPAEDMAAIFPDGVAWRLPTSAHARLAHAARVADSQARSIFRLL